jgi:hypothetical protein
MAGRERHDNEGIERRRANKEIHVRSVFANFRSPWQIEMLKNHYPAIVGLPAAAAGAFVLVTLFRQVAGVITLKIPGFSLEGAAGPILLWAICFLAMAFAIKMIWPLKP